MRPNKLNPLRTFSTLLFAGLLFGCASRVPLDSWWRDHVGARGEFYGASPSQPDESQVRALAVRSAFSELSKTLGVSVSYSETLVESLRVVDGIVHSDIDRRSTTQLDTKPIEVRDWRLVRFDAQPLEDGRWVGHALIEVPPSELQRLEARITSERMVLRESFFDQVAEYASAKARYEQALEAADLVSAWQRIEPMVSRARAIRAHSGFDLFSVNLSGEVHEGLSQTAADWFSRSVSDMELAKATAGALILELANPGETVLGYWRYRDRPVRGLPTRVSAEWMAPERVISDARGGLVIALPPAPDADRLTLVPDLEALGLPLSWLDRFEPRSRTVLVRGRLAVDAPPRRAQSYVEVTGVGTTRTAHTADRFYAEQLAYEAARLNALAEAASMLHGREVERSVQSGSEGTRVQASSRSGGLLRGAEEIGRRVQWEEGRPRVTVRLRVPIDQH